ncbi:uroporphyrinogen-III synthase [Kocuria marina]|uniref:uroporphyrinogen-III synthase n=1 Tax=Kocuria marina TaxID=223184 RepID=UPI0022E06359|nr:uroporphyrinogen-III synthase [Kocuria marina]
MTAARVLITRDPASASALAALLRERGYEPCASPLLEAQLPSDVEPLRELLAEATGPSGPTWLCVTSATTVAALAAVAPTPQWGAALDAARRPSARHRPEDGGPVLRVAAVGEATVRALGEYGVGVDFVPARVSSAAGMLQEWPEDHPDASGTTVRALVPVSALASDTLVSGLRERGYDVVRVTAYDTVPAPADRPLRVRPAAPDTSDPDGPEELGADAARAACASGELAAVVVTAPSRANALLEGVTPASTTAWIAIGEPTARALRARGIEPVTAAQPTPAALADAVSRTLGGPETSAPERDDHAEPATTAPTPTLPATTSPATTRPAATQRFR